jgi:peptidoglycan hydrolase-like protein with peptidoglycan-binding domain
MDLKLSLLRQGHRGPQVKLLQSKLEQLGYEPGPIDGVFGRQTLVAVKAFQEAFGLAPDGLAGKNTLTELNGATEESDFDFTDDDMEEGEDEVFSSMPSLSLGSEGDEVAQLQGDLMALGYEVQVSGLFDDMTQMAVQSFQLNYSLEPTGEASGDVYAALEAAKAMQGIA